MNAGAAGAPPERGQIAGTAVGKKRTAGPLQRIAAIACSFSAAACLLLLVGGVIRLATSRGANVEVHWLAASAAVSESGPPLASPQEARVRGQIDAPADTDFTLASAVSALAGFGSALDDSALDQPGSSGAAGGTGTSSGDASRANRWQVLFAEGLTEARYAQQLDSLGMELGVLNPDGQIQYVSDLTLAKPTVRTGPASAESRLYLTWSRGDLIETDSNLMAKAGIDVGDRIVLHFCSPETEQQLAESERSFAGKKPEQILQTRFVVKPWLGGHRFVVLDQTHRE